VLLVTGVHEEAQEEDLANEFGEFGDPRSIHLNLDRQTGFTKGYALIEYDSRESAEQAIEELNGKDILGQQIEVSWAFLTNPKGEKGGAKGHRKRHN